jgi:hypothetical protein
VKITVSPIVAGSPNTWGTAIVLASGAGQYPEGLSLDGKHVIDVVQPIGASFIDLFDRGGRSHTIAFRVPFEHADIETSQEKLLNLSATLPGKGLLRFYCDPAALSTMSYCAIAGLPTFRLVQEGVRTLLQFSFICGAVLTEDPAAP